MSDHESALEYMHQDFSLLPVTQEIPPEERQLSTIPVYVVQVPDPKCSRFVFSFLRKSKTNSLINNTPNLPDVSHLKRVKRLVQQDHNDKTPHPTLVMICPAPSQSQSSSSDIDANNDKNNEENEKNSNSLLESLQAEIDQDPDMGIGSLGLKIFTQHAPSTPAYTRQQHSEWSSVWPITYVPPRTGAKRLKVSHSSDDKSNDAASDSISIHSNLDEQGDQLITEEFGAVGGHQTRLGWKKWVIHHLLETCQLANANININTNKDKSGNSNSNSNNNNKNGDNFDYESECKCDDNGNDFPIACRVVQRGIMDYKDEENLGVVIAQACDTRISSKNPLEHAVMNVIDKVANLQRQDRTHNELTMDSAYLLTNYHIFMSHEPCMMCSMALVHSRVASAYFVAPVLNGGGLGGSQIENRYGLHELGGLNHRFKVWRLSPSTTTTTTTGITTATLTNSLSSSSSQSLPSSSLWLSKLVKVFDKVDA